MPSVCSFRNGAQPCLHQRRHWFCWEEEYQLLGMELNPSQCPCLPQSFDMKGCPAPVLAIPCMQICGPKILHHTHCSTHLRLSYFCSMPACVHMTHCRSIVGRRSQSTLQTTYPREPAKTCLTLSSMATRWKLEWTFMHWEAATTKQCHLDCPSSRAIETISTFHSPQL